MEVISPRMPTKLMLPMVTRWKVGYFPFFCPSLLFLFFKAPITKQTYGAPSSACVIYVTVEGVPVLYQVHLHNSPLLLMVLGPSGWLIASLLWLGSAQGQNHIPSRCPVCMKFWPLCLTGCSEGTWNNFSVLSNMS